LDQFSAQRRLSLSELISDLKIEEARRRKLLPKRYYSPRNPKDKNEVDTSENLTMNNICYHSGDADEIHAILRNGFIDTAKQIDGLLKQGVYITDAPGEPDQEYPRDQLLEITLAPEIDLRKWRIMYVIPGKPCRWAEWIVPAALLNKHGQLRLLTGQEWKGLWAKHLAHRRADELMRAFDKLVADGYLEIARDAQGQPIYRRGEPSYIWSEKGRQLEASGQEPPPPEI
jgi:hypothetical protein